ncbi:hypothetical protein DSCO28_08060 [Desulfosarcina ovata subsp. sediminis]|uniref:Uncharacterized protein n=1 Tax=Desulfosarcina ovata subsp. sediminis TaxID=885957 RepID=A0A5K7ZNM7_9BACT|nr:hypothetical protein DSCO28_08060 [Desulfosarcina ovata subsp. sediminis]
MKSHSTSVALGFYGMVGAFSHSHYAKAAVEKVSGQMAAMYVAGFRTWTINH